MRSTVPSRCRDPGPAGGAERGCGVRGVAFADEETVDGGARAADVRTERAARAQVLRERGRREIVRRERGKVARALDLRDGGEKRVAAALETVGPASLVEARVDVGGRRLADAVRKHQHDPEILREVERLELRPFARSQLRPVGEKERHVRSEPVRERVELVDGEWVPERVVCELQRERSVGTAPSEPGGDRDPLLDSDAPRRGRAGSLGDRRDGAADKRVVGETVDPKRVRGPQLDPVGEVDPLQHGHDLVLPVDSLRPDDEREVDLRCRRAADHCSECASATNSCGSSCSARTDGSRPSAARAPSASSRDARPVRAIEFGSVFLRCANALSVTAFTPAKARGPSIRSNATSAESTFGRGRKTDRETAWKPVRRVMSCMSTETAPYAFVPGTAKKRSATSRWTITHQSRTEGIPSSDSTTTGVAMLYGRFATSFVGGGASAARSSASASPKWSATRSRSRRCGSSERSTSTAWTSDAWAARWRVRTPSPGPISRTTSAAWRRARRAITPRM